MNDRGRRLAAALQADRLHVFVPAVMSVGLVFWVLSELRELARDRVAEERRKRAAIAAGEVAALTLGRAADERPAVERGLRPRPVYVLLAVALLGGGLYALTITALGNLREDTPTAHLMWLPAVGIVVATFAFAFGFAALATAVRWPTPPPLVRGILQRTPMTTTPTPANDAVGTSSWRLAVALSIVATTAGLLTVLMAFEPSWLRDLDEAIAGWLHDHDPLADLTVLDPIGQTQTAVLLAGFIGLASMRCRVLATAHLSAVATGLLLSLTLRPIVARTRPPAGILAGGIDSFPSGHVLLGTLFAGLVPLTVAVLAERRWVITPLRITLGVGVLASATHRAAVGTHWPGDVLGGALIGIAIVIACQLAIDTPRSHHGCHSCLWSADPHRTHVLGAVRLSASSAELVRVAAHVTASGAAIALAYLTLTRSVPASPDGFGFGASIATPAQLALAGLVSVGALVAWRWEAPGAVLIALGAVGLGIFASIQYRPLVSIAMTASLLVPAVLLWLGWQHERRPHEIVLLAVGTFGLLGGVWIGASQLYDSYFGPTHPDSAAPSIDVDLVDWVWTGALAPTRLEVVARLADEGDPARVVATAVDGTTVRSEEVDPGEHQIVRLALEGLEPATAYSFHLEVGGEPDEGRGRGGFTTPAVGPQSFRVAVASCARVGANGAVYDAIAAVDPLLYLAIGDIHYGNIEDPSVEPFLGAFDHLLTRPGQAALYREVPIAYVWDDHDYGPDEADASSPTRSAARHAYRAATPHYPVLPGDEPINQAFTIGRVRFILTDGRSERTEETLLGEQQLTWLIDELTTSARSHALVVWGQSVPWIEAEGPAAVSWGRYPQERRQIADAIAEAGIDNLVMVSGDAHMVALDDGTSSDYSTSGGGGFPVLHAAALDRPGHIKGGPYSEGAFPGAGQFGVVDITDDGGPTIDVRLSGRTWDGRELVALTRTFDVSPGP